jgi:hypothetical protein
MWMQYSMDGTTKSSWNQNEPNASPSLWKEQGSGSRHMPKLDLAFALHLDPLWRKVCHIDS